MCAKSGICVGIGALLLGGVCAIPGLGPDYGGLRVFESVGQGRPFPKVPRQLEAQKIAMRDITRTAQKASAAATQELLELLNSTVVRDYLHRCCSKSGVPSWSSERLLEGLRANVEVAELVHNFDGSVTGVMTVDVGRYNATSYFPSNWQLLFLNYSGDFPDPNQGFPKSATGSAEEGIFKLQPFKGQYDLPTDYTQASSRLSYVALNQYRIDGGNPDFGTVSAIFSPKYWGDAVAVAPTDTGLYTMSCNETYIKAHGGSWHPPGDLDCRVGTPVAGVAGAMDHVILSNHRFFAKTQNAIGQLFARWHGDDDLWTNVTTTQTMNYFESNILANVLYADRGLKLLVGRFTSLFGSSKGTLLQQWARRDRVALAWFFGTGEGYNQSHMSNVSSRSDTRLLDLSVASAAEVDVQTSQEDSLRYNQLWKEAADVRSMHGDVLSPESALLFWRRAIRELPPAAFVGVPRPGDCLDWISCLGKAGNGKCVCYQDRTETLHV